MLRFRRCGHHLLFVFLFLFLGDLVVAVVSANCNQTCGNNKVPYPFGSTDGCPIRLNCSESSFQIGEFRVRNITDDYVLLDVPPSCNRSVRAADSLVAANYALTKRNGLVLRNCTESSRDVCNVSAVLFENSCDPRYNNNTCFYSKTKGEFIDKDGIAPSRCSILQTSAVSLSAPSTLELSTAELEWWLEGPCRCSEKANFSFRQTAATGQNRFRCRCLDGWKGDGYPNGTGCVKVPDPNQNCSPTKYMSGQCDESTTRYGVIFGAIIAGASTMAAVALVCCFIRRQTTMTRRRKSMRRLLSEASCTVPLYSYKDIEKATDCFSSDSILGTGAYGTVYAGTFSNDRQVAIKKIKNHDNDSIEQVMNEIKLVSSVSHPNLVRLLGCCVEQGQQILVYEYMPHGTLAQNLLRERGPALPWTVRLAIATETAKAIAYLHTAVHPPIYHRDIKTSNILLDHNYSSKVSDFGLSRMGMGAETSHSHISTAPQGTPGYVDPQYHQNFHLSDKSDVYSFGVVLVEIITAMKAVDFSRPQSEVNLAALAIEKIRRGQLDEIIDPYLDPHRDAWTSVSIHKVAELAFRCLAFHRDMRPSMTEVADELEQIKLTGWAPADDAVFLSTESSFCSSPSSCSTERTRTASKKSRRLMLMNRSMIEGVSVVESPVSVQDPWYSEQSSPSANSLLGNAIH
ncbi:wall-associated receptor kinase-like 14 [Canna indica]|uniref:Wall-associated receptor kinase-like 14 n=1 Tax=Canna indica TaxID=4628 RepID=A0AAQ3QH49_9LILI|nr:wall-associated receptor kinase-like 14 [Canna indica]